MKKLRFNAVHTRKKRDQCDSCSYYVQCKFLTVDGPQIFEFCTAQGHKGIIIQYKDRTERQCLDYKALLKTGYCTV